MKNYYDKTWKIGELAKIFDVNVQLLRHYDKEGLLSFVKRSESGTRLFTKEDFEPLYTITVLKKSGMPIRKIREFMSLYLQGNDTIHERYVMFNEQRESLLEQIGELEDMLKIVDYKCWYFQEAEKRGDINYYKKLPVEEVDQRIIEFNKIVDDFREGVAKED